MTKNGENTRIRYDEGCLAAHALNVIGDRWALLVVRELMFCGKRFQTIRAGLPGISAAVLTQRLKQLIEAGIVTSHPTLGSYGLTKSGQDLLPVLQTMARWAARHPGHDPKRFISPAALVISMTAMIGPDAVGQHHIAGLRSGMESFSITLNGDGIARVVATHELNTDFILEGSGNNLASAVYGPRPLKDLIAVEKIDATGDIEAAQKFVNLFSLRQESQN